MTIYETMLTLALLVDMCATYLLYEQQLKIIRKLRSTGVGGNTLYPTRQQALTALNAIATGANDTREQYQDFETIRAALNRLPPDA